MVFLVAMSAKVRHERENDGDRDNRERNAGANITQSHIRTSLDEKVAQGEVMILLSDTLFAAVEGAMTRETSCWK